MTFNYSLPESKIAQRPVYPADSAKLLVIDRKNNSISESTFDSLHNYLNANDCLILNKTKVIPARLFGTLQGSDECEVVLESKLPAPHSWRSFGRPMRKFKPGTKITFSAELSAEVVRQLDDRGVELKFSDNGNVDDLIESHGVMPIPPYIREGRADETDKVDYQTIFAEIPGSIAAPTASLHFTKELFGKLKEKGVNEAYITLHVGVSSIFPVSDKPSAERFEVPDKALEAISICKKNGGKVIAVGTTSVRALESSVRNISDSTDLFITPGHEFMAVDAVITNFHQPGTTHLMLVEAFLGHDLLSKSYQYALDHDFRFLSYGDGMLII